MDSDGIHTSPKAVPLTEVQEGAAARTLFCALQRRRTHTCQAELVSLPGRLERETIQYCVSP